MSATPTPTPAAETPPDRPPSTGNEMPKPAEVRLSLEDAQKALTQVDQEMQKPTPNCDGVVQALLLAIPVAAPKVDDKTFPYYSALQRCAMRTARYQTVVRATAAMLPLGAEKAKPEELVHALVQMGEFDRAAAALAELGTKMPDGKVGLLTARTELECKREDWKACLAATDTAMKAVAEKDPKLTGELALKNRIWRGISHLFLGKLDEAEKDFAVLDAAAAAAKNEQARAKVQGFVTVLRKKAAEASATQLVVDTILQRKIALGVYHLMGTPLAGAPLELRFYNHADRPRQVRVEVRIEGVTEPMTKMTTLLPGAQRDVVLLAPPLKAGFDLSSVRSEMPTQLVLAVTEVGGGPNGADRPVMQESVPVTVLPRDSLPLWRETGADSTKMTPEFIAAWVTPNAKSIEAFLTAAKQRHPKKTFSGEQSDTLSQVKAVYDELKARGVSYVMDPTINTDLVRVQRTRLPREVLESTNAQCLEGTILFATAMEAIGLRPIVVLVPGHAFVGWHSTAQDGLKAPPGAPIFLETTAVGSAPFEAAVKHAMERVATEDKKGNFKRGASQLIELAELRGRGVTPQPLD